MPMSAQLLPAFDQIIEGTRRQLAAIPDDKLSWRPHEKSWTIGELGTHLANLSMWTKATLDGDEFDVAPVGEEPQRQPPLESTAEILAHLDENAGAARDAIEGASDEELMKGWTLLSGGEALFTLPKVAVLRMFIMDHMIHHRGQLTVYLRLLDVPVPQTFGPTADFPDM